MDMPITLTTSADWKRRTSRNGKGATAVGAVEDRHGDPTRLRHDDPRHGRESPLADRCQVAAQFGWIGQRGVSELFKRPGEEELLIGG